jgi:hypothetical protein
MVSVVIAFHSYELNLSVCNPNRLRIRLLSTNMGAGGRGSFTASGLSALCDLENSWFFLSIATVHDA